MATSEAQKRAVAKWQAEHMCMVGVKMRKELRDAFRAACEQNGTTMNAVLLAAARAYIEQHKPT